MSTRIQPPAVTRRLITTVALVTALAAAPPPAAAQPQAKVIGTFTVAGKTTTWKQIYVSRHQDVDRPSSHFLIVLVADRPVTGADRDPARLEALAATGQVQAIRMLWHEGFDGITTTPFHKDATDSGTVTRSGAILDITRYDEQDLEAQFKSKMLGQNWHFNAFFKGKITPGPPMKAEDMDAPPPTTSAPSGSDPASLKRQLGAMGFEWTEEGFSRAVKGPNADAVKLFMAGGMSANTKDSQGLAVLLFASMYCSRSAEAYEEIAETLLAAGADANVKDQNDSTPLIWAAQSCSPRMVGALITAGGDVNARAKGSATPLMMAEAMNRAEVVAVLKKAGAKPWR